MHLEKVKALMEGNIQSNRQRHTIGVIRKLSGRIRAYIEP